MRNRKSAPGDFGVVLGLMAMLALPAWLTLRTVQTPRPLVPVADNPTPLGYTWSLLLFLVPILVIGGKVLMLPESTAAKKAFGLTMAALIPVGLGLDIFFARTFFVFPNRAATLGWNLPGYVWGQGFERMIPVEEFAFYAFGFIAILLTYVWADRVWLQAYSLRPRPAAERAGRAPPGRAGRAWQSTRRLAQRGADWLAYSPWGPVLVGAGLFGLAWVLKRAGPAEYRAGVPGYMWFLLGASVVPAVGCFRIAAGRINWRAFGFTLAMIVLISLFWEATLGVPYQWWGYRPEPMMGIFIDAWCDLPLEAVLVWVFANGTTVLMYETILFAFEAGIRPFWRVLFLSHANLARLREQFRG